MNSVIELQDKKIEILGFETERRFSETIAVDKIADEDLFAITVGIDDPEYNNVVHTHTQEKRLIDCLKKVKNFYSHYQVSWNWTVSANCEPNNLSEFLLKQGFRLKEKSPGMYLNLKNLPHKNTIENLTITEAQSKDDLSQWIIPLAAAFPGNDDGDEFRLLNARVPHGSQTSMRHFTGFYQQQPVTSLTLFLSERAVTIQNMGTLPQHQGHGYASSLILHALHEAKKLGFDHCYLASTDAGFHLYQHLGFKTYCFYHIFNTPSST